jgi:hypothetical protein
MTKPFQTETILVPRDVTRFHKIDESRGVFAGTPYAVRVQVGKRLTNAEVEQLGQIIGYAWAQHIRGERLGAVQRHGHSAVVFHNADSTKSVRDDLGEAWDDFVCDLPLMVKNGTPVRMTNRKGPGTKGTRLVNGLGDVGQVTIWVDDVWIDEDVAKRNAAVVEAAEAVTGYGSDEPDAQTLADAEDALRG